MGIPLDAYNRLTRKPRGEFFDLELPVDSGVLPDTLKGVLFRNGPGSLESYGVPYEHLFDGDGYIQRFEFDGTSVRYTAKFVRTPELQREWQAERPLYRSFGTNLPGGMRANALRFHFKNAANTNLLPIGSELLALWEGGSPYRVDAATLDTLAGQWTNGGMLSPRGLVERLMGVGLPFSAHPKHLVDRHEIINFGLLPGLRQKLLLHRLPATEHGAIAGDSSERLGQLTELILPKLTFIHDFVALKDGRRVMFDVPVAFHLVPAFLGLSSPAAGIREDRSKPTVIRIIDDRQPDASPTQQTVETEALYVFHFPNGFVRDDGTIVVDACVMDHFPSAADIRGLLHGVKPAHPFSALLTRFEIDPESGSVSRRTVSDLPMELPTVNPAYRNRDYRYVWGMADPPGRSETGALHGIAKFDVQTGQDVFVDFFPGFPGEPLFVPKEHGGNASEDEGWILVLVVDTIEEAGRIHVLDAQTMEETARLRLPQAVHVGFHGLWR
ncbi:MAG: carotenoid oxygenase family protein [Spirochaetaceae bacterium]